MELDAKTVPELFRAMLAVASAMGCDVEERIVVRDRETGEVSR